jgi:hypothetical protein
MFMMVTSTITTTTVTETVVVDEETWMLPSLSLRPAVGITVLFSMTASVCRVLFLTNVYLDSAFQNQVHMP